jgi:hypothetical protein
VPATPAPPGPVSVNVVALIVAGAITELNVALTVALRSTAVAPFAGTAPITVGNAGLDACSRPHPAARAANPNASKNILPTLNLRISFSCSIGDQGLRFDFAVAEL